MFVPKAGRYFEILNELHGYRRKTYGDGSVPSYLDGSPFCGVVSDTVSVALKERGLPVKFIGGGFDCGWKGHNWLSIECGKNIQWTWYIIYQVDGAHMIVIMPSELEPQFGGLGRNFAAVPRSFVESDAKIYGPAVKELYDLFRR